MTKVVFRQKTPEEVTADKAAKEKRDVSVGAPKTTPSLSADNAKDDVPMFAVSVESSDFASAAEPPESKPKKGRKK